MLEINKKENLPLRSYPDPVEVLLSNIINLILNSSDDKTSVSNFWQRY